MTKSLAIIIQLAGLRCIASGLRGCRSERREWQPAQAWRVRNQELIWGPMSWALRDQLEREASAGEALSEGFDEIVCDLGRR